MTVRTHALYQPWSVRNLELRNRFVMSPMTRNFSPGGVPGPDVARYYARRAAGEVGLIVTEGVGVDEQQAIDSPRIPVMHGDEAMAGWKAVVDAVHAAGGKIVPQLWHQGAMRDPDISDNPQWRGHRPSGLWGTVGNTSSPADYVARMEAPHAPMTDEEIADSIAAFGRSARRAIDVGFDGIAIHGAHGYLIDTFFWADTNRREDRYGGDAAARARFGVDIVAAIRREIGEDYPIFFRFSQHKQQDYDAEIATTPDELAAILVPLAEAGVDVFDASIRRFNRRVFGEEHTLAGWARRLTGKASMAVGGVGMNNWLRDMATGRGETLSVDNLDEVEQLFDAGEFDLVAVGRALINDPEWTRRAVAGEAFAPFERDRLARLE